MKKHKEYFRVKMTSSLRFSGISAWYPRARDKGWWHVSHPILMFTWCTAQHSWSRWVPFWPSGYIVHIRWCGGLIEALSRPWDQLTITLFRDRVLWISRKNKIFLSITSYFALRKNISFENLASCSVYLCLLW